MSQEMDRQIAHMRTPAPQPQHEDILQEEKFIRELDWIDSLGSVYRQEIDALKRRLRLKAGADVVLGYDNKIVHESARTEELKREIRRRQNEIQMTEKRLAGTAKAAEHDACKTQEERLLRSLVLVREKGEDLQRRLQREGELGGLKNELAKKLEQKIEQQQQCVNQLRLAAERELGGSHTEGAKKKDAPSPNLGELRERAEGAKKALEAEIARGSRQIVLGRGALKKLATGFRSLEQVSWIETRRVEKRNGQTQAPGLQKNAGETTISAERPAFAEERCVWQLFAEQHAWGVLHGGNGDVGTGRAGQRSDTDAAG